MLLNCHSDPEKGISLALDDRHATSDQTVTETSGMAGAGGESTGSAAGPRKNGPLKQVTAQDAERSVGLWCVPTCVRMCFSHNIRCSSNFGSLGSSARNRLLEPEQLPRGPLSGRGEWTQLIQRAFFSARVALRSPNFARSSLFSPACARRVSRRGDVVMSRRDVFHPPAPPGR